MKKVISAVLALVMALSLVACAKTQNDSSKPNKAEETNSSKSVLTNDFVDVNGIYIDNSKSDENKKLVYLFCTLKANDKNLTATQMMFSLFVNDTNEYETEMLEKYEPKYTDYYYSRYNTDVLVGTTLNVCYTFLVPNGDLAEDKVIKLKTSSDDINVDDIVISFSDIKALNGIKEIANDLNPTVYNEKLKKETELLAPADDATAKKVKKGMNGRYWEFYSSPFAYKIEFEAPNNFVVTIDNIQHNGTYKVGNGCVILTYPGNEIIVNYTCNDDGSPAFDSNGSIMFPEIAEAFVADANYDGTK